MLDTVEIVESKRVFEVGQKFSFRPGVNLLVGDQGTGKSTLLGGIMGHQKEKWLECEVSGPTDVRWMDFEHTPRTADSLPREASKYMPALVSRFASHGEFVLALLRSATNVVSSDVDTLFMMDEPDMALSPRSAGKLVAIFRELCTPGVQVLAAVHNPIVIAAFDPVLDLELGTWVSGQDYLDRCLEVSDGC